jgi:hypothetical protein
MSAIDLVERVDVAIYALRKGPNFDQWNSAIHEAREAARAAISAQSDTITRLQAALEPHGEALFALSDRLRASGVLSASDAVHEAYERVVKTFQALSVGGE